MIAWSCEMSIVLVLETSVYCIWTCIHIHLSYEAE